MSWCSTTFGYQGIAPRIILVSKTKSQEVLLMAEILHQLIGSLSHYSQAFIHPRWCRISSINSMTGFFLSFQLQVGDFDYHKIIHTKKKTEIYHSIEACCHES